MDIVLKISPSQPSQREGVREKIRIETTLKNL